MLERCLGNPFIPMLDDMFRLIVSERKILFVQNATELAFPKLVFEEILHQDKRSKKRTHEQKWTEIND